MQDKQILLERARAQANKALVAFIDEEQSVLTPSSGCPYKGQRPRRRVGLKEKIAKRLFAVVNGLTPFARRSKRTGNDESILRDQVELLGEALTKIVVELEIIRGDMPLSGPQALLFADDALQAIKQLKARECIPF
jgi:hypothetical protein